MTSSHVDLWWTIDMTEATQTEAFSAQRGCGKSIHSEFGLGCMKDVTDTVIQLIIEHGAPVLEGRCQWHIGGMGWRGGNAGN